jgi:type IV secretory pathway TrbF-like protein
MSFSNSNPSYGHAVARPESSNPYAHAAAAWDDRIGSSRIQARNWRYVAFVAMLLALISTAGALFLAVKKQVLTYVVEVDKAGMPGRITLVSEPYRPDLAQVGYFVGEVVRLVRDRPLDPVVMRQQWTRAYQFLAGPAVNAMNDYAAADSGLRSLPGEGATARIVEIGSVLQKSEGTFQVRWVETTYSGGLRRSREEYTGLFQVKIIRPRDESDTFKNPIGVYITNFTWGREFAGPIQREEGSAPVPRSSKLTESIPNNPTTPLAPTTQQGVKP